MTAEVTENGRLRNRESHSDAVNKNMVGLRALRLEREGNKPKP
jgi:hypothetical protein